MSGGSRRDSPVYRQLHQLPHPAAFEHGLLRGSRVEHGAEPEGGIVPCCAHLGTGMTVAQGVPQPPPLRPPQWGGGTYVDGAVTEAVHNPLISSPRLCAGKWPDPNGRGEWMEAQRYCCKGTPGEPCYPPAPGRRVPSVSPSPLHPLPYLSTTLRRVSLPTAGPSCFSPGLLWGTEGSGVVGAPPAGGPPHGHPKGWVEGATVTLCLCHPPLPAVPWGLARNRAQLLPKSLQRDRPVLPPLQCAHFLGCQPPAGCVGRAVAAEALPAAVLGRPPSPPAPRQLTVSPGPMGAF